MLTETIPHPPITAPEEWLAARLTLLDHEKELTKHKDRVNAERRRLPMVKVEKPYVFDGPNGKVGLAELFEGKRQLIVYHFMYDPEWTKGCGGCTWYVNQIAELNTLHKTDTNFVLISRAPLEKLEAYKELKGWNIPWYSSFGSDFNYDFDVTLDDKVKPKIYNYRPRPDVDGRNTGIASSFASGTRFSTPTARLPEAPRAWPTHGVCWTSRPTAGRRTSKTRRKAGPRALPTARRRVSRPQEPHPISYETGVALRLAN